MVVPFWGGGLKMNYKSCENGFKQDLTRHKHKSPLSRRLLAPPWTTLSFFRPVECAQDDTQKEKLLYISQSIMPHLCEAIHLLILKLFTQDSRELLSPLSPTCARNYLSNHISYNRMVSSVFVCVWERFGKCRQVSQWQRDITLPGRYQPCDPRVNFIAMGITISDLWPRPLASDPAGNITHTDGQTEKKHMHTPVHDQLGENK